MLYQKLGVVSLCVYAFLTSPTMQSNYFVSVSGADHTCVDDANGVCNIHCDEKEEGKSGTFDCGNAGECYFYCEEKKCAEKATIIASDSNNLYVIANGDECMKKAIINAPNSGNATFDMANSKKGFKEMQVYAGTNTQNIIIDINSNNVAGDDCKGMQVYGSTAEYVEISLSNGLEWKDGLLHCPVNSPYNGANMAPCIIDASNGNGIMKDIEIVAPEGMPKNVWIIPGIYQGTNTVTCSAVDTLNGAVEGDTSTLPMDVNSDCWWNWGPTIEPTIQPTLQTAVPSMRPTSTPTASPSTPNPSQYPSKTPSTTTQTPTQTQITYASVPTLSLRSTTNTNTIIATQDMLKYDIETNKGIVRMFLSNLRLLVFIVSGALLICCCLIIFCCIKKKHSKGGVSANEDVIHYQLKSNSSKHVITVSMSPRDITSNHRHKRVGSMSPITSSAHSRSRVLSNYSDSACTKRLELNVTASFDDVMPLQELDDNDEEADYMDSYASSSGSEDAL